MNYKFTVAYKGTNYNGWAIQTNQLTIQGILKQAFYTLFDLDVDVIGSGRTDKGVHAYGQVFNVKHARLDYDPLILIKALNSRLPVDIRILDCEVVEESFHARFNAVNKTYIYKINENKIYDLFLSDLIYQYNKKIDLDRIQDIIPFFIGKHDFLSFSTSELKNTVREIISINIQKKDNIISFEITGNGFLRNMVRMIIGCFLIYSEKKITKNEIHHYFLFPKKGQAIIKVPACGLYLMHVKYLR